MRLQTIIILGLTLAGFALRLHYLTTTHPFFDEYTTVLAARQILARGWPVLPSGLFYEHGLLATYVIAPFTALFINTPIDQWQPAHWGLMLARWPSVILGTVTIPLIYSIGRKDNCQLTALLAAGLFAFSPEGMVWGGRARMYALATLLVLLTVIWAYRGALYPAPARYRWGAMLALLAALLTQFGAMLLVPPLVIGMIVVGWWSYKVSGVKCQVSNTTHHALRVWFLRPAVIIEGLALAAIVGAAILVKRLGQPLGAPTLGSADSEGLPAAMIGTVAYQTAFNFSWADTVDFLAEQFGPPHLFWLAVVALMGAILGVIMWLIVKKNRRIGESANSSLTHPCTPAPLHPCTFSLFLWLIFGLILLEAVTLLNTARQNPRYLAMFLPLFYLIAANSVSRITYHVSRVIYHISRTTHHVLRTTPYRSLSTFLSLAWLTLFTWLGLGDLRIALVTPEPAYEHAFQFVQQNWQPGDTLLTMNTPAAALYLGRADGFTVQSDADQFLLNRDTAPIDRWLGSPWVGTAAGFNAALNAHPRVWFVIDTIRLPVYFRADWQAVINSQMEQVWAKDNALIYRTRPERVPLPTQPEVPIDAILGNSIRLTGYTLQPSPSQFTAPDNFNYPLPGKASNLHLTLFWQALRPISTDYTVFLHLRNSEGGTITQRDGLSLDGTYPTSRWQPSETVLDPFTLSLPADLPTGAYTLWAGMYQLDTLERLPVANDTSGENAIRLGDITFQ